MVASQFIRVDMETKQILSTFKKIEREPFNEVIKRLIFTFLEQDESLTEPEKKAILKAISAVEKGKTQSFEDMIKNIQKKRASKKMVERGELKNSGGLKDAVGD